MIQRRAADRETTNKATETTDTATQNFQTTATPKLLLRMIQRRAADRETANKDHTNNRYRNTKLSDHRNTNITVGNRTEARTQN